MRNTTTNSVTKINVAIARQIRVVVDGVVKSLRYLYLFLDARCLSRQLAEPMAMRRRARQVGSTRQRHVTWRPARPASEAASSTL